MSESGNGYAFRLAAVERRVERIEGMEPAVVRQQVADLKEDIGQLSEDIASVRRILIGFLVTFAVLAVTTIVTVMQITQAGP